MRNVLVVVVAIGLLAAPSLGLINVKLVADQTTLVPGQTTTIHILGQGTEAGLYALGGNITASGTAGLLVANAGSFAWVPEFNPVPQANLIPRVGTAAANGGWSSFGSEQTNNWAPSGNFAKLDYAELASYTVTAQAVTGDVTLTFSSAWVSGFKPIELNFNEVLGTITPVTITTPEPATLALILLAGLAPLRRRYA